MNENTSMKIHYRTVVKKFHADQPPDEGHEPYEIVTSEGIVNNDPPYDTQVIAHTVEELGERPAAERQPTEQQAGPPSDTL